MEQAVRRLVALAEAVGDSTSASLACEIAEQLPRGDINVLVVGQFKRGKSTLVNAMLGADVMPTGTLPLTGVATAIRYGDTPAARVWFGRDRVREVAVDELPLYVSERYNPGNRLGVERVDVAWPAPRIRGIALFDTPGTGSTYEHNSAAAREALPRADAAILVVGPDPPMGADELRYAREVIAASERLFVVLNKSDVAGDGLPEIVAFTREVLSRANEQSETDVTALSATLARDRQRAGEEDPAFAAFVAALHDFVRRQGAQTRERSARRRAGNVIDRLGALVSMRVEALNLPRVERARRKVLVQNALRALDDRVRALELSVDDDAADVRLSLDGELDALYERDLRESASDAEALARERSPKRRAERFQALLAGRADSWQEALTARAAPRLHAAAEKYARLLSELETSVIAAGCEALHVDAAALAPRDVRFDPAKLDLLATLVPTTGLEIAISAAIGALPAFLRKPALRRRYRTMLASELDALRGTLRYAAGRALDPWRRGARATTADAVSGSRNAVLAAFGDLAGRDDAPEAGELARAIELQRELAALKSELERQFAAC